MSAEQPVDNLFVFGFGRPAVEQKAWKALERSFYGGTDWDSRQIRLNSKGMRVFRAGIVGHLCTMFRVTNKRCGRVSHLD